MLEQRTPYIRYGREPGSSGVAISTVGTGYHHGLAFLPQQRRGITTTGHFFRGRYEFSSRQGVSSVAETNYHHDRAFLPWKRRVITTARHFFRGRDELSPRPGISSVEETSYHHGQNRNRRSKSAVTTAFSRRLRPDFIGKRLSTSESVARHASFPPRIRFDFSIQQGLFGESTLLVRFPDSFR